MPDNLWHGTSGPLDAPIVIVGEAFGAEEERQQKPFVGSSGVELNRMLAEAGIDRNKVLCTNVVAARPPQNELWRFFHEAKTAPTSSLYRGLHPGELVSNGIRTLHRQIDAFPRRLVIAAGNYPLWALSSCTGSTTLPESFGRRTPTGIMSWRGSMWYVAPYEDNQQREDIRMAGRSVEGGSRIKLLPIIHPAAIMRQWSLRAVTVHDLKARVPLALNNDWRHENPPIFYAPPSFEQATGRLKSWLAVADAGNSLRLACDIETKSTLITCVGFADSPNFAMAIPFVKKGPRGLESYWTLDQEVELNILISRLLSHPSVLIEGQNFIYDTQYFQRWNMCTPRLSFDTMLAQNLLFPGTPKGLDYLSSLYCKYHWYWKEDGKEWDGKGSLEDLLTYNCWDLVRTFECATTLRSLISRLGQEEQWEIKKKVNDLCLRMMNRGIRVDHTRAAQIGLELAEALSTIHHELGYIIPQELVNPDAKTPWYKSAQQTNHLFYEVLGLRGVMHRKTGKPTGGKEALNELPKKHPEFTALFDRLRLARSIDNTAHVVRSQVDSDGRMRCSFNPAGTETHRLSSSKNAFGGGMNLQNLTKGEEDE